VHFIHRTHPRTRMARSKTGSFTLTERVNTATATAGIFSGTIDLGAYVDVGDQQAIAIESVDFVSQVLNVSGGTINSDFQTHTAGDLLIDFQLSDLNPGDAIMFADDNSLIASGAMYMADTEGIYSIGPDFYPDNYGKLDESRMVVNDQLYFVCDASAAPASNHQFCVTARIRCRIVKLSTKDWMAIAIQSTASDN